ncbi:DNA polymerase/3'-5' exonuclease PolX [Candidatus Aenigmatarchaeota archaeon]
MKNQEIAKILYNIALYLEMKEDLVFKIKAYEKAAQIIESLPEDVGITYERGGIAALEKIRGIGRGIAEKIEELVKTGKLRYYEKLKKEVPVDIETLSRIEGMGPRKIFVLYKKLKVKNVKDLEAVAKKGKISKLEGFGEKSEKNILKGIGFVKKSKGRYLIGYTFSLATEIEKRLNDLPYVKKAVIAGSFRRRKETVGDIDILVISNEPEKVMDYFTKMKEVINVFGKGKTKSTVLLENGMDADLRVVKEKSYGAALNYFTGSKTHNVALRRIAIQKKLKLSEYGLFSGQKQIAGKTEEELYKTLGLRYIEPEMRENTGEIEIAKKNKLPKLIKYGSLLGDLQIQTTWSDGSHTIEQMANAAKQHGLKYISITDHTKSLAWGIDEKKLLKQGKEIDKLNKKISGFRILKGAELNIMKDGGVDIKSSVLKDLDCVGAGIHSAFRLSRSDMTKRIINVMENEHVDILFHPTGRIIQKREACDMDIEKIIDTAKRTGTILEIDSPPGRLDLKDDHIRMAVSVGAKLCIDTDAHDMSHYNYLNLGIAQARRGWAQKKDVINTLPLKSMLKKLK